MKNTLNRFNKNVSVSQRKSHKVTRK